MDSRQKTASSVAGTALAAGWIAARSIAAGPIAARALAATALGVIAGLAGPGLGPDAASAELVPRAVFAEKFGYPL